jgi:hypothetical protein
MYDVGESLVSQEMMFSAMVYYSEWLDARKVMEEIENDQFLKGIVADLQQGKPSKMGFSFCNGVLFYDDRLVLSASSAWIPTFLKEFHSTHQGGHSTFYRT